MQPGVYRLRLEQNGFRFLNAFGASKCIGETDPPGCVLRLNLHKVAGNRCGHVPLPGCHVNANASAQNLVARLILRRNLFQDHCRIVEHSQLEIAARCKDMPLPIGFQGIGASWMKKRTAFVATQVTSRKAPAFGGIDQVDFEVDFSQDTVRVWFQDRYEWHPVYPFYDFQGPTAEFPESGDEVRETNCLHAALVELKSSGAADYWMKGQAEVALSLIIKP